MVPREEDTMKRYALIAAAAFFVGMSGAAFAECDPKKADTDVDKQAKCSEKCEDHWIDGKQHYATNFAKLKSDVAACFEKCDCKAWGDKILQVQ
jgi:hypothetical protein